MYREKEKERRRNRRREREREREPFERMHAPASLNSSLVAENMERDRGIRRALSPSAKSGVPSSKLM